MVNLGTDSFSLTNVVGFSLCCITQRTSSQISEPYDTNSFLVSDCEYIRSWIKDYGELLLTMKGVFLVRCLCDVHIMNWWPTQGAPHPLTNLSWDRLQWLKVSTENGMFHWSIMCHENTSYKLDQHQKNKSSTVTWIYIYGEVHISLQGWVLHNIRQPKGHKVLIQILCSGVLWNHYKHLISYLWISMNKLSLEEIV